MKRSTQICTLALMAAAIATAAYAESAGINYGASKSNTGNTTIQPCSPGATVTTDPATGKQSCGEVMATPLNNRQNLSGATATPGQSGGTNERSSNSTTTAAPAIVKEMDKTTPQ